MGSRITGFFQRIGIFIIVLYTIACIALYVAQNKLIFDPSKLSDDFQFRHGQEVEVPVEEDLSLNCLLFKNNNPKGVILYLHGNRGSNRRCTRQAEMFEGLGYDIFMPDYRGYGKSEGSLCCEDQMYHDVQSVYNFLLNRYEQDDIVVLGYSLGTGMATYLAANNSPKHLVLIAPYLSFIDLKNRIFPLIPNFLIKFPLNTEKMIANVACPISIFHGTADEIIPYDSSEKLASKAVNATLTTLEGTGHRRTIFHDRVRREVGRVLGR